jgi:hypothetical protein
MPSRNTQGASHSPTGVSRPSDPSSTTNSCSSSCAADRQPGEFYCVSGSDGRCLESPPLAPSPVRRVATIDTDPRSRVPKAVKHLGWSWGPREEPVFVPCGLVRQDKTIVTIGASVASFWGALLRWLEKRSNNSAASISHQGLVIAPFQRRNPLHALLAGQPCLASHLLRGLLRLGCSSAGNWAQIWDSTEVLTHLRLYPWCM